MEIECLPADIPSSIEVDVSGLVFGKVVRVEHLPHNEKLEFITDANHRGRTSHGKRRSGGDSGKDGGGGKRRGSG